MYSVPLQVKQWLLQPALYNDTHSLGLRYQLGTLVIAWVWE